MTHKIAKFGVASRDARFRRGTKSYRSYEKFCGVPATLRRATARQYKKAVNEMDSPTPIKEIKGRVIRSLMRMMWAPYMEAAERAAYGNWR